MTRTSAPRRVALLACAAPSAAAEPVNGRIAFTHLRVERTGSTGDIWTMKADGSGKQQAVFHPRDDAQADWSPDGTKIVYRSRRNNQIEVSIVDFRVRDRPGARDHRHPEAPDGTQSSQPAWFPDMAGLLYRRTNGAGTTPATSGRWTSTAATAGRSTSRPKTSSIRASRPT